MMANGRTNELNGAANEEEKSGTYDEATKNKV